MDIYERIQSGEFDAVDTRIKWNNKEISYEEYKAAENEGEKAFRRALFAEFGKPWWDIELRSGVMGLAKQLAKPYEGFVGYKEFLAGAYGQVTSIVEVSSELTADAGNHHANRVLRMLSPDDNDGDNDET